MAAINMVRSVLFIQLQWKVCYNQAGDDMRASIVPRGVDQRSDHSVMSLIVMRGAAITPLSTWSQGLLSELDRS
jgi:hypothetical protein